MENMMIVGLMVVAAIAARFILSRGDKEESELGLEETALPNENE